MHNRLLSRVAVLAVFFLVVVAGSPLIPRAMAQQVFDSGHVDAFFVTAPGGKLTLSMKEDITGHAVERPGDDVILGVSEAAWSDVTESIPDIGQPAYYLPQTQDQSILWPGWDTQPAQEAGYTDVNLEFLDVSGPGAVYAFETAGFGDIHAVTRAGSMELASGDVINQPYPAHRHVNWAFTEPGTYTMTVRATSNGDASNQVTYTWRVGDGSAHEDSEGEDGAEDSQDDESTGSDSEGDGAGEGAAQGAAAGRQGSRAAGGNGGSSAGNASSGAVAKSQEGKAQSGKTKSKKGNSGKASTHKSSSNGAKGAGTEVYDADYEAAAYQDGSHMLPWGLGLLGLGLLALGLGVARLALAKAQE